MDLKTLALLALVAAPTWPGHAQARPTVAATPAAALRLLTADDLRALAPRAIGPAVMAGRVSDVALHPRDPWTFYVGLATGGVMKTSDGGQTFQAVFDWNSPLVASAHERGVLYLAGNRVFRLEARGEHWRPVSPDLSAREPEKLGAVGSGAEDYAVVCAFAESPLEKGLLWAGTDDGKLWVTLDGGGAWSDFSKSLPAEARGQWINRVEPGHFDARTAYLVVDAHRAGNYAPLVWRTADLGRTWERIGLDLLFAGTETGLYVSLDRGRRFVRHPGIPTVPVDDLLIHPRARDLIVATHGRSLYVIDDVSGLDALTSEALGSDALLFEPRAAEAFHPLPGFEEWNGAAVFRGENPPPGAALTFWLRDVARQGVTLSITDAKDRPIAELKAPGVPGFGRVTWDLKIAKDHLTEYGGEGQKFVAPGEYKVKLSAGAASAARELTVTAAPGVETR